MRLLDFTKYLFHDIPMDYQGPETGYYVVPNYSQFTYSSVRGDFRLLPLADGCFATCWQDFVQVRDARGRPLWRRQRHRPHRGRPPRRPPAARLRGRYPAAHPLRRPHRPAGCYAQRLATYPAPVQRQPLGPVRWHDDPTAQALLRELAATSPFSAIRLLASELLTGKAS